MLRVLIYGSICYLVYRYYITDTDIPLARCSKERWDRMGARGPIFLNTSNAENERLTKLYRSPKTGYECYFTEHTTLTPTEAYKARGNIFNHPGKEFIKLHSDWVKEPEDVRSLYCNMAKKNNTEFKESYGYNLKSA